MNQTADRRASDMNAADITALVAYFISLGVYFVGASSSNSTLIGLSIAIAVPAGVVKVMSSRAKYRRSLQAPGPGGEPRDRRTASSPSAATAR